MRAVETGYYDNARRREGDVFVIEKDEDFSERWMERVNPRTPEHTSSNQEALRREHSKLYGNVAGRETPGPDNPTGSQGVLDE